MKLNSIKQAENSKKRTNQRNAEHTETQFPENKKETEKWAAGVSEKVTDLINPKRPRKQKQENSWEHLVA
ncbi:hypothetical protein EV2_014299 [Malus domestica]